MAARHLSEAAKRCMGKGPTLAFRAESRSASAYLAEITEIGLALAITGAPPSADPSSRMTCPAWGDCNPSLRAMVSIRSGLRS